MNRLDSDFTINAIQVSIEGSNNEYYNPPAYPSSEFGDSFQPNPEFTTQQSAAEITQERLWNDLSSLYSANESLKGDAAALDTSTARDFSSGGSTAQKLDDILDRFMEGANTVLGELTMLGNSHPILALAIFAFHEVVKLDIARRDNNKKVLVVVLHMQSMLGPMFQVRNLDHTHMPDAERQFHENRLKDLVETITQDIKVCRSDITHFMNRKFVYKLVLAKGYEKKFASHIETFALRRAELQSVISEYLAISASTSHRVLASVDRRVDVMDGKLDRIISTLFRNLDTPRERDVFSFIAKNGGEEKCVNDLDLLPKLIAKAGESPKTGKVAVASQTELEELRKALTEALKEDLDKVLEKHFSRFEKVLQVQSNNLRRMSTHLEDQGVLMQTHTTKLGKILDTVTTIMVLEEGKFRTKAVKLKDPEIQRVWQQMNLMSSSVKAKVFVLTFRDHIRVENSAAATPVPSFAPLPDPDADPNTLQLPASSSTPKESDEWVLEYIDVAYVQPIVEAMDEDGSGFISVKEANSFALARPKDISLLHWIAYWAAGWHINITHYQKEIYAVMVQMHQALPEIHLANRTIVDDYLDNYTLSRVEALLRSIRALPDTARKDHKLHEVANAVASSHIERLKTNLNDMGYVIESGLDATTIAGAARVETWILPLLLLLLQRHLDIINLAKTVVLDSNEFSAHLESLRSVFSVFDERKENIEAKLRQLHRDIDAQFQSFSYGMFYAAFKKTEYLMSENTLLRLKMDEYADSSNARPIQKPDISILSKPPGKPFELDEANLFPPAPAPADHVPHPVEGVWYGWFRTWDNNQKLRPYRCVIHPVIDGKLVGKAEGFFSLVDLVGTIAPVGTESSTAALSLEFQPMNSEYRVQVGEGIYNAERDRIEGTFVWKEVVEHTEEADEGTSGEAVQSSPEVAPVVDGAVPEGVVDPVVDHGSKPDSNSSDEVTATSAENAEPSDETLPAPDGTVQDAHKDNSSTTEASNPGPANVDFRDTITSSVPISDEVTVALEAEPATESALNGALNDSTWPPDTSEDVNATEITAEPPAAEGGEENSKIGSFYLTRTPPHAARFRYLLDGYGAPPCWNIWPPARKRWAFAIEAVLYETRLQMNSKKLFEESLSERRKWIYHCIRYDLTESSITPDWHRFETFSTEEWERYESLILSVHPSMARVWEELAHYMARKETYIVGRVYCDSCYRLIAFSRHQCISCIEDDLSQSVDLCVNCFDKPLPTYSYTVFNHNLTHSLLRSRHRIHVSDASALVPSARLISERVKKMFRDQETRTKEASTRTARRAMRGKGIKNGTFKGLKANAVNAVLESTDAEPILCGTCNKAVSLPCWVCIQCSPLKFTCEQCERKIAQYQVERDHHLIWIHDSVEVKPVRPGKLSDVERQLEEIGSNLSILDEKINTQIEEGKEMKVVVDEVAKTVGVKDYDQFSTMTEGSVFEELAAEAAALVEEANMPEASDTESTHTAQDFSIKSPEPHQSRQITGELAERLGALETKIESINQTIAAFAQDDKYAALAVKMDALEAKMDQQFGALLALMQNLVLSSRTP